jgi:hypothetical protein
MVASGEISGRPNTPPSRKAAIQKSEAALRLQLRDGIRCQGTRHFAMLAIGDVP